MVSVKTVSFLTHNESVSESYGEDCAGRKVL